MPRVTPLKSSINAGEFSPLMAARSDFALYPNAAKTLENFLVLPQGGATRRPGTKFVAEAKASSGPYRLIPFERSADQAYVIEVGQGYFRFYTRQGQIEVSGFPGTPYELATPYTSFDPYLLQYAQQADIMILVHPDFPPQQLTRIAEDNWTITEIEFDFGPFLDENETATTVIASSTTAPITLTASAALWTVDDVGALFALGAPEGTLVMQTWAPGDATIATSTLSVCEFEGRVYRATNVATTGNIAPTHTTGDASDGAVTWRYIQTGLYSLVRITAFTSTTSVDVEPVDSTEILRFVTTAASTFWRSGAWSETNGYPRSVTLLDNRAWYGGTTAQPQTVWGSVVGRFEDFRLQGSVANDPITDDGAINATLQASQVSVILWLTTRGNIIAGTSNGPWTIDASSGGVITPSNIIARRQSTLGCSIVPALEINSSLLFVPRDRRHLHDLRFDFDVDKFEAVDMTLLSDHILASGVKQLAYQSQPLSTLWAMLDDGSLSTLAFNRAEEIRGWSRQVIAGDTMFVRSIATIPGDDQTGSEDRDEVWLAVERRIDGATVTYVEFVQGEHEETEDIHDAWHLDAALQYIGVSTATITGLDHLEGETVAIWGDSGAIEADKIVSSGQITLDNAVTSAIVGLLTTCTYQPLAIDAGSPTGTALTKRQKFTEIRMLLYLTSGIEFSQEGTDKQNVYDLDRRILQSNPYTRLTGQYGVRLRDASWRHNPEPIIENSTPGPTTILGIVPFIDVVE
ncbi:MAG: hypothetical protein ACR2QF_11855 [Geminicoccaceae bacterium]